MHSIDHRLQVELMSSHSFVYNTLFHFHNVWIKFRTCSFLERTPWTCCPNLFLWILQTASVKKVKCHRNDRKIMIFLNWFLYKKTTYLLYWGRGLVCIGVLELLTDLLSLIFRNSFQLWKLKSLWLRHSCCFG